MEHMRRKIMEEQMALVQRAREEEEERLRRQAQDGTAPGGANRRPFNPEVTSLAPRNKHAAPPKVKLYQPALNIAPPAGTAAGRAAGPTTALPQQQGGVRPTTTLPPRPTPASSSSSRPTATTIASTSSGVHQPFKPPTRVVPGQSSFYSPTAPPPALGPFANSIPAHLGGSPSRQPPVMSSAATIEGDVLDEPEPPLYGGPTISAADRDRQLQEMVEQMVKITDVDISKAKIDGMKCMLLPHQIQGVQWMKDRENVKYKGGILADDMGLGKTVQMLALIVSNRPGQEGASIDNVAPDSPVKKRGPKPKYAPPAKSASTNGTAGGAKAQVKGHSTLIIAPLAVVKQWEREVLEKTEAGLRVYVHHGPKRAKTAAELSKYDIVVTTYTTASSEHSAFMAGRDEAAKKQLTLSDSEDDNSDSSGAKSGSESDEEYQLSSSPRKKGPSKSKLGAKPKRAPASAKGKSSPLFDMDWLRVVLDEAQNIKNHNAKCSKACFSLSSRAHSKWCLTGTPIQNDCYELFSLIHFLRIAPFDDYKHFKKLIGDPLKSTNGNRVAWGIKRLGIVLQSIMLRRTKDATYEGKPILQLPGREVEVVSCDFDDPEERNFYAELESTIRKNKSEADAKEEKGSVLADLVMLLRLRQACSHPTLTISKNADLDAISAPPAEKQEDTPGDVNNDDDDLAAMFSSLTVARKACERCQVPLPPSASGLCESCSDAVRKMKGSNWTADKGSTKIRMMLKILDQIRQADKSEKTIVFSQFTSFLDLVEPFLRQHKYNFVRYDGKMRPEERELNLERIRSHPSTTVILISFKAGSTGLNLTCCSRVILMDLWWNPQIEEQAFDRAHRLGQQRDVKIYKLSITKTVEERILDLQHKKRELAKAALEGSKLTKANRLDKTELMYLFNGGPREGKRGGG